MRALLRLASLALAATAIYGSAPALAATAPAHHSIANVRCPAGTNWNHVLHICQ